MAEDHHRIQWVNPQDLIPHPRRSEAGPRYDTEEALQNFSLKYAILQADIESNGIKRTFARLSSCRSYYVGTSSI